MSGEQHRNLRLRHADGDVRHGGDLGIGGLFRGRTAVGVGTRCLALVAGMNRDDIIHMAREAGFEPWDINKKRLYLFAEMVAAAERRQCELLVWNTREPDEEYISLREAISEAIYARNKK